MLGPLLWGPLSEIFGRRPIFIITFIAYIGFQVGCALSKNTASILVFRFLGGTFAAAPLTNSGALIADIWDGDHRGKAMCKSRYFLKILNFMSIFPFLL
jgi:MFS family permease